MCWLYSNLPRYGSKETSLDWSKEAAAGSGRRMKKTKKAATKTKTAATF